MIALELHAEWGNVGFDRRSGNAQCPGRNRRRHANLRLCRRFDHCEQRGRASAQVGAPWQAWNALDGHWWASGITGECSVSQPCTWSELKARIGGTSVILIPYFELGASGDAQVDTSCALDRVVINGTTYDLEKEQPREEPGVHPGERPGEEPGEGPEVPVAG